jgi:hypothetical protein
MKIIIWLKYLKNKVAHFDLFELGNSAVLYYLLIFYLVSFLALVGFSIKFPWGEIINAQKINYQALFYLTLGLIFLIFGYFSPLPKLFIRRVPNILKKEWNFKIVPWVFGVCFTIGTLTKILRIFGGAYYHLVRTPWLTKSIWYGVIGYLDWFSYIALVIAFASYFYFKKNKDDRYWLWCKVAWGAFAVEMIYALPMCGKLEVIVPVILYLIVKSYLSNIKWWKIVAVGFIIALFLFPYGNLCKYNPISVLKSYSVIKESPIIAKDSTIKAIKYNVNFRNAPLLVFDSFVSRIDQSEVFSKILEKYPPFLYGKPLLNFFIAFPPRLLWKDKPTVHMDGNAFGHSIGVLSPEDTLTSVGPTIVGDWYMNFGVVGIVFGMLFMGFLWRIFYEYLIKGTKLSLSGVLIYSIVFIQIIKGIENEIASVYAGLVKFLIILLIIHFFLTRKDKKEFKSL